MSTQHNDSLSFAWLMPVFEQQLVPLTTKWQEYQQGNTESFYSEMAQEYHQLNGAMQVANLPVFARLAQALSAITTQLSKQESSDSTDSTANTAIIQVAYNAHDVLYSELKKYANSGSFHQQLVMAAAEDVISNLNEDHAINLASLEVDSNSDFSEVIELPKVASEIIELSSEQKEKIVEAWEHHHQQLIEDNSNNSESVIQLHKMSQFIWRSCDGQLQKLWYLADIWLNSLRQNIDPKPQQYGRLIEQLAHMLPKTFVDDMQDGANALLTDEDRVVCERLIAELYIQITQLKHVNEEAQKIVEQLKSDELDSNQFFVNILQQLEPLIFQLDDPKTIIQPLTDIRHQLEHRGWQVQVSNAELILADLNVGLESEEAYESIRWQVERQLQELYGAILLLQETIDEQIGQGDTLHSAEISDNQNDADDELNSSGIDIHTQSLRQVRIAVETIKNQFNQYTIKNDLAELPEQEVFATIKPTFLEMDLPEVNEVVDSLSELFNRLRTHDIERLNWSVIGVIADCIAEFELFLDHLAQQVLETDKLANIQQRVEQTNDLLTQIVDGTQVISEEQAVQKTANVVRYSDKGKIQPEISSSETALDNEDAGSVNNESIESIDSTEAESSANTDISEADIDNNSIDNNSEKNKATDDVVNDAVSDVAMDVSTPVEKASTESNSLPTETVDLGTVDFDTADSFDAGDGATTSTESPALQAARDALNPDDFTMNEDLKEIFIEDAEDVLQAMAEQLPKWQQNPNDLSILKEINKGFQTLKSSGRTVGANNLGEMSWAVENMLNGVLDNNLEVTPSIVNFIVTTKNKLPSLVIDFANQQEPNTDLAITVLQANNLLAGREINEGLIAVRNEVASPVLEEEAPAESDGLIDVDADADVNAGTDEVISEADNETVDDINVDIDIAHEVEVDIETETDSVSAPAASDDDFEITTESFDFYDKQQSDVAAVEFDIDSEAIEIDLNDDANSQINDDTASDSDDWLTTEEDIFLEDDSDALAAATTAETDIDADSIDIDLSEELFKEEGEQLHQTDDSQVFDESEMMEGIVIADDIEGIEIEDMAELPTLPAVSEKDAVEESVADTALESDSQVIDAPIKETATVPLVATEESPALQAAREALNPDDFTMDEDIREIFIEEAEEVLEEMTEQLPIWEQNPSDLSTLKEIRRGFHTLKGSGRMVGANNLGEMSWAVENMLNRVLDNSLEVTPSIVDFIVSTKSKLPSLVVDFANQQEPNTDPAITVLQANNLLAGKDLNEGLIATAGEVASPVVEEAIEESIEGRVEEIAIQSEQSATNDSQSETEASELEITDAEEAPAVVALVADSSQTQDFVIPEVLQKFLDDAENLPEDSLEMDEDIREIFIEEAEEVLEEITPLYSQWAENTSDNNTLTEIRRGFHTLKGSGRMVGANQTGELAWSIESMLNRILDGTISVNDGMVHLLNDVLTAYPELVSIYEAGTNDYPSSISLWVASAHAYSKGLGDEFDYLALTRPAAQPVQDVVSTEAIEATTAAPTEPAVAVEKAEKVYGEWSIAPVAIKNRGTAKGKGLVGDELHIIEFVRVANETLSLGVFPDDSPEPSPAESINEDEKIFIDIFIEEAKERLAVIDGFWQSHQGEKEVEVTDELVRAFHTLRGASGATALQAISEISDTLETHLAHLQHHESRMTAQHLQAVTEASSLIATYIDTYEQSESHVIVEKREQDVELIQSLLADTLSLDSVTTLPTSVDQLISDDLDQLLDAEWELGDNLTGIAGEDEQAQRYASSMVTQIQTLQMRAADSKAFQSLLAPMLSIYAKLADNPALAGSSDVVDNLVSGHEQLTGLFDALASNMSLRADDNVIQALTSTLSDVAMPAISMPSVQPFDAETADDKVTDVSEQTAVESASAAQPVQQSNVEFEEINTDDELLEIFLEEAQELEEEITQSFSAWRENPNDLDALKELQRHLHTIKGGARMGGISSIGDLTHEMETIYEKFVNETMQPSEAWLTVMQAAQDTLSMQIEHVSEHKQSFYTPEIIEQLLEYGKLDELPSDAGLVVPVVTEQVVEQEEHIEEVVKDEDYDEDYDAIADNFRALVKDSWNGAEPDEDILSVFLEEADELVESSHENLQSYSSNTGDLSNLQALQRELHTIKGGARMVGANGIADLSHEMETVYEELGHRRLPGTKMILQLLTASHDWVANSVHLLKNGINPPTPTALIEALKTVHKNPDSLTEVPLISLEEYSKAISEYEAYQRSLKGEHDTSEMPPTVGNFGGFEEVTDVSNEMIRVPSGLMEQMINLSGESAINRARIDMGMSSLTLSIEEMGTTVQRLADQLRRMEIELEAQIMAQIDDEKLLESEDFDPLEMDQYSSLNQLSKSLTESASDLLDIKSTLLDKTRDGEGLLLQLSRTQNELQRGLMSSRMVPFSRLTPRLQRIVRQTANEIGKQVELSIVNADDEMDRTILERITSPLEHMLRNAVDHGVEFPYERAALGKDKTGEIKLSVVREGGEMVIQLTDDGSGIDVESVRNKAIKQGLIDANDESLTDTDIMQYIFNAGLSTTKKVTQISGRGVGMDVVRSEIRQLGGTVGVESVKGKGSTFTMRVPLTVAISDALVVRAADRQYAIPLVQIERVEQVNPDELYAYYQSSNRTFNIAGVEYRLRYLNEILTGTTINDLSVTGNATLPVIIIKNQTGQSLALQVDEIVGSRIEVVVKPLGKQLSHVSGVSAATIMGDGSVMMILDLMALMRNAPMRRATTVTTQEVVDVRKKVLVIDDSVTVRKVTSRFLEREGFDVHVAKDGIDAIEILQEFTPHLMLLDIEMPRMDGFEVATQVRRTERLQDIPIIMITSRTGDKHRERAMEIGVNDYLGKPFQENVLMERISQLIDVGAMSGNNG